MTQPESKLCPKHNIKMHQPDCSCHDGYREEYDDFYNEERVITCWKCHGTGVLPWLECDICNDEFIEEQMEHE